MKINKIAEGTGLHAILFLVILVVLIFFASKAKVIFDEQSNEKTCSSDVQFVSLKNDAGLSGYESKMRCEPNSVVIKQKDPEMIEQELARNMLKCWTRFDEGKANLFSNKRRTQENYCIICSYISFKHKGIIIDDFLDYLMTHKPYGESNPQGTYFERMYGSPVTAKMKEFTQNNKLTIDTSKEYATLFTYAKKVGNWDKINAVQAGGLGGFGLGAGGGILLVSVLGLSNPLGWVALASFSGATALGVFGAVKAPWNVERDWTAGIFLIPFTEQSIIDKSCTKLGS